MFSTRYVPAGKLAPFAVNALSATETFTPPTFHGSVAERQSPRWGTASVPPLPATVPVTLAFPVSSCIGFVSTAESPMVYAVTSRS